MSSRTRRDRLEVKRADLPKDDVPTVVRPEPIPAQPGSVELPYVEPDEYGLRVNWQSEPVGLTTTSPWCRPSRSRPAVGWRG